jgi:error-prone DNA polymerase
MSDPYVELHAHSAFSFLDGASAPEELAERAAELGHEALALTDHDGLCGSLAFAHAARAAGVRPITGCEITLVGGAHLTLLAATGTGYGNLCRLITLAHAQTRRWVTGDGAASQGSQALPPALPIGYLERYAAGLVCLTGCMRHGLVPQLVASDQNAEAEQWVRRLVGWFDPGAVAVEIQRPRTQGDRALSRALVDLAHVVGIPAVATGDVHAHHPRRAFLQDAFVAIRNRTTLDGSEDLRRGNRSSVLRTPAEMAAPFREYPGVVAATRTIAELCTFDLTRDLRYRFPDFIAGHPGETAQSALTRTCMHQLGSRYPNATKRVQAQIRLEEELSLIAHHGLAGFFLLHRDLLELARDVALEVRPAGSARRFLPPGRGRGSSVGSIVCYLTGLSHIDPVANGLFLGRFLNRDMASVPDIDLDFPRDVRARLIEEVVKRYGTEHAALVAAFPTFRIRMAIRELGSALALPEADLERLVRLSDGWSDATAVQAELERLPDGAEKLASPRWRALAFLAAEAAGLPRHLSQHSGGMVVSAQPLVELVPVVPAAFAGRQICQWDKDSCADAGFVKIDLLGLGMLSAVEECIEMIADSRNETVDLSRIGFSDPKVYAEIQAADTIGTFQIESRAQMQSLLQTQPENLDDLTVQVALIRPGPVSGGAVHPYVRHRKAKRADPAFEPPYDHPLLADVLRETLGVVVFQEQVLEVSMALAGFTPGQAEALRRAMSRKRSREAMLRLWAEFQEGARARGVDDATIKTVFTKLIGFSNFGFPKAHSAAFAVLAYQSAWLRQRYPAQFLASLLNSQPMGFYPPASLVRDAQRRGVRVLAPCVANSDATCVIEGEAVRIGLAYIRGVRLDAARQLIEERVIGGPFSHLADLAARSTLRREQLTQLVRAGACDVFDQPRRRLLWQLATISRPTTLRGSKSTQLALPIPASDAPPLSEPDRFERVVTDYETMGLSVGWHLVALVRPHLPSGTRTAVDLRTTRDGTHLWVAGMVVARQRPATANGIVFLLLEDETGMINVIVKPDLYEQHRALVRADPLLAVWGKLERKGRNINVVAERIERVAAPPAAELDQAPEVTRAREAVPSGQDFGRGRR